MDISRTDVNIHKLDPNKKFYVNMDKYLRIKVSCLSSYRIEHDFQKELNECSTYLAKHDGQALLARNDDPEAVLELAVRYLSGCNSTRKQSLEGALHLIDMILDRDLCYDPDHYVGDKGSATLRAQAHSCAAKAYFGKHAATIYERKDIVEDEERFGRLETLRIGFGCAPLVNLSLAAQHANESVKLGLVSPAVIQVGLKLRELGEVLGVDVQAMASLSKKYRPLWRAVERRIQEVYAEERKLQQKIEKSPNQYACAADGCGIRGESKAVLRACAGKCPRDLKPSYCGKKCQAKDWPRHREICKPGSTGKAPQIKDKAKALELFELSDAEDDDEQEDHVTVEKRPVRQPTIASGVSPRSRGYVVDVPAPHIQGGSIHVTLNTMDPEFMRAFRDGVAKLVSS